ncbi:multiple antibiotic resistance protein [Lacinutrix venerupis]|uniref:MarC family NAAT transporter n=1 Tax=Lacinutrix venerupis TaxID=1486034 RepID=UPI000EB050FA|nr:MarC family NAAT transporter [Lacinutrix venerupis]RLJ69020.1 multiple antibiotic resistance protein [Lacinutrix venerupis]
MELLFIAFGALFSIMNPLGTVPVFVALTQEHTKKERAVTAFWTAIDVLIILLLSFFAGKYILSFFGISLNALKIAGGMIIASSGFALLTGKFREHKGMKRKKVQEDIHNREAISLTPLAIPMLAGPGTISLLITYNQEFNLIKDICIIVGAMLMAALTIYLVLKSAHLIVRFLGASGINALSRIIGFIVIAIGVEYIIASVMSIFSL